jgi:hypothetical protein
MPSTELDTLHQRLKRARARCESAPPFSPDWDAAMGAIEELELRIAELERSTEPELAEAV